MLFEPIAVARHPLPRAGRRRHHQRHDPRARASRQRSRLTLPISADRSVPRVQTPIRLHCMMVELIEDFLSEYPVAPSVSDKVDTGEADEVIVAVAKTVAELTSRQDGAIRQH